MWSFFGVETTNYVSSRNFELRDPPPSASADLSQTLHIFSKATFFDNNTLISEVFNHSSFFVRFIIIHVVLLFTLLEFSTNSSRLLEDGIYLKKHTLSLMNNQRESFPTADRINTRKVITTRSYLHTCLTGIFYPFMFV